ncbi:hypothetical protein GJ698_02245 [Pseudoduganella sp. FT26W]|uniref:Uncharacterized protein n=1 Tax=Duganella aquatilis TaxID=2666082 RepID=A0A844D5X9_9BURK|nr:hypothetical protein [Duganella aquatilis]MRW82910.1 hypothetical protein [Duganella aquatilis]
MANTKKRRKAYKPKPCVLPLGMRKSVEFEMPGFQASVALGMDHLQEQHIYDLLSNADLVRRIAPAGHEILPIAHAMVLAIAEIQARAQRVGKHGVTGDEMRVLREGVGRTMVYLRSVPNVAIARAAQAAVAEFDLTGVLRV